MFGRKRLVEPYEMVPSMELMAANSYPLIKLTVLMRIREG
jgi:hypothetical protein